MIEELIAELSHAILQINKFSNKIKIESDSSAFSGFATDYIEKVAGTFYFQKNSV